MEYTTEREYRTYRRLMRRRQARRKKILLSFLALMVTISLTVICAVSYDAIKSKASSGEDDLKFKYYASVTVQYGETLWDIADEYIDYTQYKNKAAYISEVKNINHLDPNGNITAGETVILPYYSSEFKR